MKIVAAKCTNCGGVLEVDAEKDAAVCKYCNTPFIVEKAIENYNITNNYTTINNTVNNTVNNISGQEVHIHQDGESPEQLLENIKALLKRNERDLANKTYQKLKEKYPADYRVDEACVCLGLYRYGSEKISLTDFVAKSDASTALKNLKQGNPDVYGSYYEQLLGYVNQYLSEKTGKAFRGRLLLTKAALIVYVLQYGDGYTVEEKLKNHLGFNKLSKLETESECGFLMIVDDYLDFSGRLKPISQEEDTDDEFVAYLVAEMDKVLDWSQKWKPDGKWFEFQDSMRELNYGVGYTTDYRAVLSPREKSMRDVRDALLKNCLSSDGKKKLEEEQKRKIQEAERVKREKRKNTIKEFWNMYVSFIRSKQTKAAYDLMLKATNNHLSCASPSDASKELAKFKKGIFGVKYFGDVNALNADDLINATLAAEGLK